jgi:hypothetical protein
MPRRRPTINTYAQAHKLPPSETSDKGLSLQTLPGPSLWAILHGPIHISFQTPNPRRQKRRKLGEELTDRPNKNTFTAKLIPTFQTFLSTLNLPLLKISKKKSQALVAHTYNPSYSRGWEWKDCGDSRPAWAKCQQDSISTNNGHSGLSLSS